MNKTLLASIFAILFFTCFPIVSQNAPHIKGKVHINMETGLFHCQMEISNAPVLEEYLILLNQGMNVKQVQDKDGKMLGHSGFYNAKVKGEAIEYQILNSKREIQDLPSEFSIEYVGAFPRYTDSYKAFDFKGVIAINDKTIRATEQTKWYPVIYDVKKDKLINKYTYELEIKVEGATSIFVNGSAPKNNNTSTFRSTKAVPLLLFAGNYQFVNEGGNFILNTSLSKETTSKIFDNVKVVQSFLEKKLDRKFTDNIYLIHHKALNKRRKGSSWGFNTYPAFAFTGDNYFDKLVNAKGKFSNANYRYFCHEFGHNYFGNNVQSGQLYWFWLESFPEYLSFTFAEKVGGNEYLKRVVNSKLRAVKGKDFIPLSEISDPSQVTENYRYSMAPLILMCYDLQFDLVERHYLK